MDILGLKEVAAKLPAEMQEFATALIGSVTELETKTAGDVQAIADKVIAGLQPMVKQAVDGVNQLTVTVGVSVQEVTALARRIDGAKLTFALGSEVAYPAPDITVKG